MLLKVLVRTLLSSLLVAILASGAYAAPPRKDKAAAPGVPSPLVFPVVGEVSYTDDFGDARGQGSHEGNDLMAAKRSPVVAVEDGKVRVYAGSSRAGCMLYLYGASGTTYLYIHLNNDLTSANDNRGGCVNGVSYAPGLRDGQQVRAGQLIGYVGDSGDANGIASHLHFELHPGDGDAVSPFPYLETATRLLFAVPETASAKAREQAVGGLRLALYGSVTAFGSLPDGMPSVTVHVERVRVSTGGRGNTADLEVTVGVPDGAVLQEQTAKGRKDAALAPEAIVGDSVVLWTAPLALDLATQAGTPGSLLAVQALFRNAR